jgi:hypothetical protein
VASDTAKRKPQLSARSPWPEALYCIEAPLCEGVSPRLVRLAWRAFRHSSSTNDVYRLPLSRISTELGDALEKSDGGYLDFILNASADFGYVVP